MSFVLYRVTGYAKRDDGDKSVAVTVSGFMNDSKDRLTSVFRRHPELLPCNVIESEYYTEVLGGKDYGSYQETRSH